MSEVVVSIPVEVYAKLTLHEFLLEVMLANAPDPFIADVEKRARMPYIQSASDEDLDALMLACHETNARFFAKVRERRGT